MRVADYIAARIAEWGIRHVFMVAGGGAIHLNDAFGFQPGLRCICCHHEQAAAMAAEGYSRITGRPGVINVTTGPGGINALNGVFGAWTDSIPMLIVSGQVRRETCMATAGTPALRQLGDQEADILAMARSITKYAVLVTDPQSIRHKLERAWHLAQSGRPGPCWIDVPIDVQAAPVDPATLAPYHPTDESPSNDELLAAQARVIVARLARAQRPVILAGSGIRHAHALPEFEGLIRRLRVPVTTAWTHDLIASDDELYCGRPGTIGDRAGNFTVQNSDLLLVLGSRLNIRQVSYNWQAFAPHAYKIQVDIDLAELSKPTVHSDLAVPADLKRFLPMLERELDAVGYEPAHASWLQWCRERRERYPVVQPRQRVAGPPLNPYHFIEQLSAMLAADDVIVCGNATATIVPYQVLQLRRGQRLISNSGAASMGYDLPAAIGAAFAHGKRVICIAGDGSLQMNIQELQTVAHHHLPVKILVLNNDGYLSLRSTQTNFFGRRMGESAASGISFPDYEKIACAYGIPALRIDCTADFDRLREALAADGPALVNVMLDPAQECEPRSRSKQLADGRIVSPPLEDMYPFLDPAELAENILSDGADEPAASAPADYRK